MLINKDKDKVELVIANRDRILNIRNAAWNLYLSSSVAPEVLEGGLRRTIGVQMYLIAIYDQLFAIIR